MRWSSTTLSKHLSKEKRVKKGFVRVQKTNQAVFSEHVFVFLLYFQAYVWGNNVYIKTSPGSPPQQVTFNGKKNEIFNGIPDWVYEGEWNIKL